MRSVFLRQRISQANGDYFGQYIPYLVCMNIWKTLVMPKAMNQSVCAS